MEIKIGSMQDTGIMAEKIHTADGRYDNISRNRYFFWCNECDYTDSRIYIQRDAPEGIQLSDLIENDATESVIEGFLLGIVLSRMTPAEFMTTVDTHYNKGYNDGTISMQHKMQALLGLRHGI